MSSSRFALPASSVLLLTFFSLLSLSASEMDGSFRCVGSLRCPALVGYSSPNATTLGALQTLFSIDDLQSILGANNLPLATPPDYPVPRNRTIRIPIPCTCSNGTGVSNRVPVYTVEKDNTLYYIATVVFRGLVQFPKIGEVNQIKNNNVIEVGQKLWIPLPCSCDKVGGRDVVHYAHVVQTGSWVGQIAAQFGTDNSTLLKLNGINGDGELLADYALDVPLRACNSTVRGDSLDSPLLLSNGSHALTANNCVRCSCDASNWTLSCEPSQLRPSTWQNCPSTQCQGAESLLLGRTTTGSCGRSSCAYAGYSNRTIYTALVTDSTCPAPAPGNYASTFQSSWNFLFVSIQLALLCLYLLQ